MTRPMNALENLPSEIILDILALLDHQSLAAITQVSRTLNALSDDEYIWRRLSQRLFRPTHRPLTTTFKADCVDRLSALREFLIRGTNDYPAHRIRTLFTQMCPEHARLFNEYIEASNIPITDLLFMCQGYALSSRKRICPRFVSKTAIDELLKRHRDRIQTDPRSQVFLLRMLLARQTGFRASAQNPELFLLSAHLIVYDSIGHPLFHFPPSPAVRPTVRRYNLRSISDIYDDQIGLDGPIVNWGVVETIHSLVKLYRDRMGEAIPNFMPSRDDYEQEVPMTSAMFEADLSGNWRGLYGYLDFRELEILDESRPFTPDYFDGIQNLKINDGESVSSNESSEDEFEESQQRFTADGHSMHGEFHIHGSTFAVPGLEPGFKIVRFDEMFNNDGIMPWIMSGVYVPSIGIIGRWRDRTEPLGEGVEGPYVLWRDRVRDKLDQDTRIKEDQQRRDRGESVDEGKILPSSILKRATTDMEYIVIEER